MISAAATKLGLVGLILFGFALGGTAHAASTSPVADIVYTARYYNPGNRPSHYKIWRINSAGSGCVQVTLGSTEDHSPSWLDDGKTILFVREAARTRTLCTVDERGGPVTEIASLPKGYTFIESDQYLTTWVLIVIDTKRLGGGPSRVGEGRGEESDV